MTSVAASVARVAVVGNPNAGKTTLFNALTGLRQKVANFPGVTVEKKTGVVQHGPRSLELIDLPGAYSLAAHSPDEMVAVDLLLGQEPGEARPDAVMAIVDASNLERNLYLVSQLFELGLPVLVVLNMMDVAAARGIEIDCEALARQLGVPVVPTQANKGKGLEPLSAALFALVDSTPLPQPHQPYEDPPAIQHGLSLLEERVGDRLRDKLRRPLHRFELARMLIDQEGYAERRLRGLLDGELGSSLEDARHNDQGRPLSALEAQSRYRWIRATIQDSVQRGAAPTSWSDRIDRVLTHRVLGTLVFAATMLLLFQAIFSYATPLMDAIDAGFGALGGLVAGVLPEGAMRSLLVDGVVGGVGGVVIFLPQILLLFLFILVLEDCGYMARAAFLMDRLMSFCGLSGKSFVPMLSGFACAIPAVMGTRVIENRRDRLATILVAPLMTCSARLPVYAILIAAFIPDQPVGGVLGLQALTLLGLYVLGVVTAMAMAWLFKKTILRGPTPPFVMEMPSYKWPQPRSVLLRLYERGRAFVVRAGSVILAITVVVWALAYFPRSAGIAEEFDQRRVQLEQQGAAEAELAELDGQQRARYLEESLFGRMGKAFEPAFEPLGWDWRITMASLASFPAREVVVATLGTVYSLGEDVDEESPQLATAMQKSTWPDGRRVFNIPVALSLMVFFALCCQCGATVATIRRETNSWGWAWFAFTYMTALAYCGALLTYQIGMRIG